MSPRPRPVPHRQPPTPSEFDRGYAAGFRDGREGRANGQTGCARILATLEGLGGTAHWHQVANILQVSVPPIRVSTVRTLFYRLEREGRVRKTQDGQWRIERRALPDAQGTEP